MVETTKTFRELVEAVETVANGLLHGEILGMGPVYWEGQEGMVTMPWQIASTVGDIPPGWRTYVKED